MAYKVFLHCEGVRAAHNVQGCSRSRERELLDDESHLARLREPPSWTEPRVHDYVDCTRGSRRARAFGMEDLARAGEVLATAEPK